MLLLYPWPGRMGRDPESKFTFHYASTLSKRRSEEGSRRISIYIPLCFYFIGFLVTVLCGVICIYIPLCFYFINGISSSSIRRIEIYIPLCFYFICLFLSHGQRAFLIYIPLCFYFIEAPIGIAGEIRIHLHSTMLLLYRKSQITCSMGSDIYIPLCFYFIEYPVILRIRKADLHSTMLLLYLIFTTSSRTVFAYLHSTMLLLYLLPASIWFSICVQFTFHYASTLSLILASWSYSSWHLHSTMLLLYLSLCLAWDCISIHLHSTMLLLYLGGKVRVTREFVFTFHYASTLSSSARQGRSADRIFTFHYASTLSAPAP